MSVVNWGLLSKSLVDDETIEEAIDRLILVHEQDEVSHLGVGESLQSHKASVIIDHVVDSIVADKIKMGEVDFSKFTANHNFIFSTFDSLDGWAKGGVGTETIVVCVGGTKLQTGNVNGDTAFVAAVPSSGMGENPNFDDLPIAQALMRIMDRGNAEVHFHIGYYNFQAAGHDYIGFFFDLNKVYAVCRKSSTGETKSEIVGAPNSENPHIYRIVRVSSVKVDFYIDGALLKTITTNIPSGDNEQAAIFIGVKNSHDGGGQFLGVYHAMYQAN